MGVGGMDLNLLVALQALLEEGNVTRAGERLGMGQPAMSSALRRLRRRYGDELLVRVGRGMELTPLAQALLVQVRQTMPLVGEAFGGGPSFCPLESTRAFTVGLSDYAMTVLAPALRRRLAQDAPGVQLDYRPLPPDVVQRPLSLLDVDLFVGPRGLGFEGCSADAFADRFVLVVDPANPHLVDGRISLEALRELSWARAVLGSHHLTPADRRLAELDIGPRSGVSTHGWLASSFVVPGTRLVALVPERLARLAAEVADVVVVPPPVETIELAEALWWHPSRDPDPAHRWLRELLTEVARER